MAISAGSKTFFQTPRQTEFHHVELVPATFATFAIFNFIDVFEAFESHYIAPATFDFFHTLEKIHPGFCYFDSQVKSGRSEIKLICSMMD